jgi:hypothetical protein
LELLIRTRLARLAAIYGRAVEAETLSVWIDAVKFITPTQIAAAFDLLEVTFIPTAACPFPVPANLLKFTEDAQSNQEVVNAGIAWEDLLLWMQRYYRPDCRDKRYPLMESKMTHAANAAGGLEHISSCPIKDLAWAKKRFTEAYLSLAKLEEDRPLLASGDVMKQIASVAENKSLRG